MKNFAQVVSLTTLLGLLSPTSGLCAFPVDLRALVVPAGDGSTSPCITDMPANVGNSPKISLQYYSTKFTLSSPVGDPSAAQQQQQSTGPRGNPFRFVVLAPSDLPGKSIAKVQGNAAQAADRAQDKTKAFRGMKQWAYEKGSTWGANTLERLGLNVLGHVQGAGILRDVSVGSKRFSRAVASHNIDGNGLVMAVAEICPATNDAQATRTIAYSRRKQTLDIINNRQYGNHSHPGGLQAVGDYIAIAMQHSPDQSQPAGVYFIRADGFQLVHANTMLLPKRADIPQNAEKGASAAGFVRLDDKRFLLAITGGNYGKEGIWFFISSGDKIDQETTWQYLDFWLPVRIEQGLCDIASGTVNGRCYLGGEGVSLIPDRQGNIYLFLFQGSENRGKGTEYEYAQAFRITLAGNKRIKLIPVWQGKRELGNVAIDDVAFRWSGSAFVNPNGALGLVSTERKNTKSGPIQGMLRVAETNTNPL